HPCLATTKEYHANMATTVATTPALRPRARSASPKLANRDIGHRLEQIELATVSSLRALQMDIDGDAGVSSSVVLKKARAALR
ncbi:MAG: hypothetical protein Q8M76_16655, partial [Spirochaetaceae bacterium]|nr:hypothetical protein [Spirochaetaceae bacterium]